MRLIVITPDTDIDHELSTVNELLANGLPRLHIRKPGFTAGDYRNYITAIGPVYRKRLVIHNCFELFHELELGGIHLNSRMKSDAEILHSIHDISASCISASFHSWQEIAANTFPYAYVFISPVFDSISKKGYAASIDMNGADTLRKQLGKEPLYCPGIIALGGVDTQQLPLLLQHHFDGCAVLGAIWQAENPVNKLHDLLHGINKD